MYRYYHTQKRARLAQGNPYGGMPVDDVADKNQEQPQLSVLEGTENGTEDEEEEEDTLYVN